MKAIKALAVLFFVVSIMLGALALRDAYDAKAVEATIVARPPELPPIVANLKVRAAAAQYELDRIVRTQRRVDQLKSSAWSKAFYLGLTLAVGAVLWTLSDIGDMLRRK